MGGIDDRDHQGHPQRHGDEERPVGEKHVGRRIAPVLLVDEVKIPKDPVQDEGKRPGELRGAELLDGLRGQRVEGVGRDHGRGHHRGHLVDEIGRVLGQDRAVGRSTVAQGGDLVPPLGEAPGTGRAGGSGPGATR